MAKNSNTVPLKICSYKFKKNRCTNSLKSCDAHLKNGKGLTIKLMMFALLELSFNEF